MDYDEVVKIALAMPDTAESRSHGLPSIKRSGRFMFALKKDGETFAVKLDWETHDRLLESRPDAVFKTPHYDGYPAFLVRLEKLDKRLARSLVKASWEKASMPAKNRRR